MVLFRKKGMFMKANQQKSFFLIALHIFLAIGALGGGGALILDPTGELS